MPTTLLVANLRSGLPMFLLVTPHLRLSLAMCPPQMQMTLLGTNLHWSLPFQPLATLYLHQALTLPTPPPLMLTTLFTIYLPLHLPILPPRLLTTPLTTTLLHIQRIAALHVRTAIMAITAMPPHCLAESAPPDLISSHSSRKQ
ncbi:hypothetical protein L210DRAFT_3549529 [Boletus edulis BED1]|uniref:Uncharacterized protein n=1 Tax=Boletus edulis BED1 TaxID=1328754 RepID=A0AAD4BQ21_BOLED|nr:hypothetical protein L210DRAFT_3549529 [Boletus edulis BED1]